MSPKPPMLHLILIWSWCDVDMVVIVRRLISFTHQRNVVRPLFVLRILISLWFDFELRLIWFWFSFAFNLIWSWCWVDFTLCWVVWFGLNFIWLKLILVDWFNWVTSPNALPAKSFPHYSLKNCHVGLRRPSEIDLQSFRRGPATLHRNPSGFIPPLR